MARKDPISHLARHPNALPAKLVFEILALGSEGIASLLAICGDRAAWDPGATDHVRAANAVQVLAVSRDRAAIPVLIEIHAGAPLGSGLYENATGALGFIGGPELVEPLLALQAEGERRADGTELLAQAGVSDPRIRARIEELFETDPETAANLAVGYGDPEVGSVLCRAFDRIDRTRRITREEAECAHRLTWAMRALGTPDEGRATAARAMTLEAIRAMQDENAALEEENRRLAALADGLDALASRR